MGEEKPDKFLVEISEGKYDALSNYFYYKTDKRKYHLTMGEYFSICVFEEIKETINSEVAFKLIIPATQIIIDQSDPDLLTTSLSLLNVLIVASNTTETPTGFIDQFKIIENMNIEFNNDATMYMDNIRNWYRLK